MHRTPRQCRTQRGNILFIILLAVVLFAALNYAVTSSMRGGGRDGSSESNKAAASRLLQYASLVENTVLRMSLDIPYQNIQYWNSANSACPTTSCRLFSTGGGNIAYQEIDKQYLLDPTISSGGGTGNQWQLRLIQIENVGTSKPEIALMGTGITKEICQAINELQGVPYAATYGVPVGVATINSGGIHTLDWPHGPLDLTADTTLFRYVRVGITGASTEASGHRSFCHCATNCTSSAGWRYNFWHVLVAQ